jgi:hypothetical protein
MSDRVVSKLKDWFDGYVRHIAELKLNGLMSTVEGKAPLTKPGYHFLSRNACKAAEDIQLGIFAWVFLVLCWNLIARCNSVASIMYDHIKWEQDAMTIVFPSHKGDKEGMLFVECNGLD